MSPMAPLCVCCDWARHFPLAPVRGRELTVYRPLLTLQMLFIYWLDWMRGLVCETGGIGRTENTCGSVGKWRRLKCRLMDSCNASDLFWTILINLNAEPEAMQFPCLGLPWKRREQMEAPAFCRYLHHPGKPTYPLFCLVHHRRIFVGPVCVRASMYPPLVRN